MPCEASIIIPVIRREQARRCIAAIRANAGLAVSAYEIVVGVDNARIGCPRMVKWLLDKTHCGRVMFLADDTLPQTGFLTEALAAMATLPGGWGLVGLNDGIHDGRNLATHWLADKRLLPLLDGEFFHTGYRHTGCDRELTERCRALGRYVWASGAKIEHRHPFYSSAPMDADYERVYSEEYRKGDIALFRARKANGWRTPEGCAPGGDEPRSAPSARDERMP